MGLSVTLFFKWFPTCDFLANVCKGPLYFYFLPGAGAQESRAFKACRPKSTGLAAASTGELTFSKLPNVAAVCAPPPVKGMLGARVTDSCRRRAFSTGDGLKKTYLLSRTALGLR